MNRLTRPSAQTPRGIGVGAGGEVVFYTHPMSRGQTVHWLLEELAAPYDMRLLDFDKREHKAPAYLAINAMGKVPAIVHRGVVVTETAAICLYLADEFPSAGLAPKIGEPQRGTYLRWFVFGAGCFDPAVVDKMLSRPPATRPRAVGYGSYEDTVNAIETALTPGPYILGERFSAVDVYVGSQIHHALMAKAIEPRPAFQKYADLVAARPVLQRLLKGAQQP
jgi:glutathione S-transferase